MLDNDLLKSGKPTVAKQALPVATASARRLENSPTNKYCASDEQHSDLLCSRDLTTNAQYFYSGQCKGTALSPSQTRWLRIGEQLGSLAKRVKNKLSGR